MLTEQILMDMVKIGGANRQEAHEKLRQHSIEAGAMVKQRGLENDLIARIKGDSYFAPIHASLDSKLDPKLHIGRCPVQVRRFIDSEVTPLLKPFAHQLEGIAELHL